MRRVYTEFVGGSWSGTRRRKAPDLVESSPLFLMNLQRSTPINISRYGRSRHKSHDFEELSCLRTTESSQSFSPNLGSPSPPETPDSSHCISRIGDYLLLEPLEGDHVFRAAHLHSGEELVCKVSEKHPTSTLALCISTSALSDVETRLQVSEALQLYFLNAYPMQESRSSH